jgi:hypothetical protein
LKSESRAIVIGYFSVFSIIINCRMNILVKKYFVGCFIWSLYAIYNILFPVSLHNLIKILYNYCTWTRSIWGFMEQSTTILNEANCALLHKTSYWSSSSVVIVLLHKALFYYNFLILWKLWNFWNFLKILSFWIFLKSYEILRNLNFKLLFFWIL